MRIDRGLFPRLMFGAFGFAIGGFLIRGFGQLAFGRETALLLATPVFGVGVLLAAVAFVLSVLFKLGVLADESEGAV
jgi:hypothetical protein